MIKKFISIFKENHYYVVDHGSKCVIRVVKKLDITEHLWQIEVIKILSNHKSIYYAGLVTNWFENWCSNKKEIKNPKDESEILAVIM